MPKVTKQPANTLTVAPRPVESVICIFRGQKVILDSDLAALQLTCRNAMPVGAC